MNKSSKQYLRGLTALLIFAAAGRADLAANKTSLSLDVGSGKRLEVAEGHAEPLKWSSADSRIAHVYGNGFVVALRPGSTKVIARSAGVPLVECTVTVSK